MKRIKEFFDENGKQICIYTACLAVGGLATIGAIHIVTRYTHQYSAQVKGAGNRRFTHIKWIPQAKAD
ncbi:hypothetical protein LCGC14_2070150 [marine sediment metagenome]|uniref:Uncharacterized protein n=1 Tax=marine sediment metagenome TaxID=412755 RepID=A0A0F9HFP9_9ZZZZ